MAVILFGFAHDVHTQHWLWLTNNNYKIIRFVDGAFIGSDGLRLGLGSENLYVSDGVNYGVEVVTAGEFDRIEDRPRLLAFPDGTLLAAGSTLSQTSASGIRIEHVGNSLRYGFVDWDGENFAIGIADGEAAILGNSILRLRNTYTFDGGQKWYRMQNPLASDNMFTARVLADGDVFVHQYDPPRVVAS